MNKILTKLSNSKFRSKFKLSQKEKQYVFEKGIDTIKSHATDFIKQRISPANIPNDGKQTPMRNHPVFVAQHATACCCRNCIYKWHKFPKEIELSEEQQKYLVELIMIWIEEQIQ